MATLLLSQGVPMLRHGDELGHTQAGNNNAYCQDNELSWLDWENADPEFVEFCRALIAFRRAHPVFRRRRFFEGRPIFGADVSDIAWFRTDGAEMTAADWQAGFAKSLMVFLNGDALPDPDPRGQRTTDDSFLLLLNAHHGRVRFRLPGPSWGAQWARELDTAQSAPPPRGGGICAAGDQVWLIGHSLQVLRRYRAPAPSPPRRGDATQAGQVTQHPAACD
jgi:glycogen operon protein